MKFVALVAAGILASSIVRADVIANGDFHEGKAHWKGNIREAGASDHYDSSSITHPGDTAPGVMVDLSAKTRWPDMYQTFNSKDTNFTYSFTFKVSQDYAPHALPASLNPSMAATPQPPPNFPGAKPVGNDFLSSILGGDFSGELKPPTGNDFLLLVVDLTEGRYSAATITPKVGSTDPQTFTGTLKGVPPHDEKVIYLVFSPGAGNVTFLNVALTPLTDEKKTDDSLIKP